ncbi:MAG TPA: azurin [Rhodanobacteraceae bacterium]|nr:azurin [Rhodanobacteraceae bacterium]
MKRQLAAFALLGLIATPLWAANHCSTTIEGNDMMQYDKSEIVVPKSCSTFTVTLKHTGKLPRAAMGHDWVLTTKANEKAVLADAAKAGLANGYLKPGDKRVIAHTKLIGGGESDSVTFKTSALKNGPFVFFCSFPGHETMMHGTLTVK